MRPMRPLSIPVPALLAAALACAGCGSGSGGPAGGGALAPQFQPQVVNATDDFQFQATGVLHVTHTLHYTWRNTGTQANVNQACSLTGGTAVLVLRDSTGAQVYARSLTDNGTFVTTAGQASAWSMQIQLTDVSGTLNFRAQKKT